MSETAGAKITVEGKSNGISSYEKNGNWFHSVLLSLPGQEQCLKIGLDRKTNPSDFPVGKHFKMEVQPRFYQGRFSGFNEAI